MATDQAIESLYATGYWLHSLGRHRDAATVFRAMATACPRDERAWLALGACHESSGHVDIALEMYGFGRAVARPSPRCEIARSRALRIMGRDDEADAAIERAMELAEELGDEELRALACAERGAS